MSTITFRDYGQYTITVKVGPDEVPYVVHKGLVCHYSKFFENAVNGSFKEAADGVVRLPVETPQLFERVMDWMYTQRIAFGTDVMNQSVHQFDYEKRDTGGLSEVNETLAMMVRLYIFGEKYAIPDLKRASFAEMERDLLENDGGMFWHETVVKAFEDLPADNPLLDYMVHRYVLHYQPSGDGSADSAETKVRNALPYDFLLRLAVALSTKCNELRKYKPFDVCRCHDHASQDEQEVCRRDREDKEDRLKAEAAQRAAERVLKKAKLMQ